ncbi:LOW QUALITY PROTEIN: zona pelucida superfamily protein qsm [Aphomia sociella]
MQYLKAKGRNNRQLNFNFIVPGSESQIECTPEVMRVTVPMDGDRQISYLDQLKDYQPCKPVLDGGKAMYMLDLQDPHKCGVTRVLNKITGKRTFYHKIVIEDATGGRETVTVRCMVAPLKLRAISRRAAEGFPLDFNEPDVLNITRYEEGHAPEPVLGAIVKENGKQVSGEISVSPGTPLSMEIFLDEKSAPVYGLLVSYMHVTDTGKQQETIILNGCSVDPYLFDNFVTTDGDLLAAKFRAFKFPDTTYVQFKGTVSVCLDKCQGVQCTNGATGYGRRRRSISSDGISNKVYEVSLTTFIKVDSDGEKEAEIFLTHLKNLKIANQLLGDRDGTPATISEWSQDKKLVSHAPSLALSNASIYSTNCILILALSIAIMYFK